MGRNKAANKAAARLRKKDMLVDEFKNIFEGLGVPLLLSMFGGIAKALREGVRSCRQFAASMVVSGFAGVIVHLLIQDMAFSASVKAALVGLSGYSSGIILDALAARLKRGIEQIPDRFAGQWNGVERRKGGGNRDE
ncbi:MAG: hypothetical protein DELT_01716 [Desulfovibrio sp.]